MKTLANAPLYDAATVARLLEFEYDTEELAALPNPPPPVDGIVTFWDPGWSIWNLRTAVAFRGALFPPQTWFNREKFVGSKDVSRYRQLRMEPIPKSLGKTFDEQQTLVPPGEEIPLARVVVMGMVIHFVATGKRLFPNSYVRCMDQISDGGRVYVGYFGSGGFEVYDYWDDLRGSDLGLASSMLPRRF